ncbi:MAG: hypothetical protein ACR2PL_04730 [Dehalococcoidia bacterium]
MLRSIRVCCSRMALPALYLLLLLALAEPRPAKAAPDGMVTGQVHNGSAAAAAVPGVDVSLHRFDGTTDRVAATATTDVNGSFQFAAVETEPSLRYLAVAAFQGVAYSSRPLSFAVGSLATAEITVYTTTEKEPSISIERSSFVVAAVNAKQRLLTVVESYRVQNPALSTYIGSVQNGQRQSLQFALFAGARSLEPAGGFSLDEVTAVPGGFTLTVPVQPGVSPIAFTYTLPFQSSRVSYSRPIRYPTALAEIILANGLQASSPQLTGHNSVRLGTRSFDSIQGTDLAANGAFSVSFAGLPGESRPMLPRDALRTQILLVLIVVAATVVGVGTYRGRLTSVQSRPLTRERGRLLQRIAQLDDRFEAGKMDRTGYLRERAAAKACLLDIAAQMRSDGQERAGPDSREALRAGAPPGDRD